MNLSAYRASALRFEWSELRSHVDIRLQHGIIGLASELGELIEVCVAIESSLDKFLDEAGDQLWYMNLIADAIGDDLGMYGVAQIETPDFASTLGEYALHVSRLSDILKKALFYRDRAVCPSKVRQHLGGALSALAILLTRVQSNLEDIAGRNITKLEARHAAKAGA